MAVRHATLGFLLLVHATAGRATIELSAVRQVYGRFGLNPALPHVALPSHAALRQPSVWPSQPLLTALLEHPLERSVALEGSIPEAAVAQTVAAALTG